MSKGASELAFECIWGVRFVDLLGGAMTHETPLDRLYLSARTLAIIWACGVSFSGGLVALSQLDHRVRSRGRIVDRIRQIDTFEVKVGGRVAVIDYGNVRYEPPETASYALGSVVSTRKEALAEFERGVRQTEDRMLDDAMIAAAAAVLAALPLGLAVGGRRWLRWLQTGSTVAR